MLYTNIDTFKQHLNIEKEATGDTAIMNMYLNSAELAVLNFLDIWKLSVSGYSANLFLSGITITVQQTGFTNNLGISNVIILATYLLASNYYLNRQSVSFAQPYEIPFTISWLLFPYKQLVCS